MNKGQGKPTGIFLTSILAFPSNINTDNPVTLKDNSVIVAKSGAFAKATSIDPEIGPAYILSLYPREELKTLECGFALTAPEPPTELFDWPASFDRPLTHYSYERAVHEYDHRAETVASSPNTITSSLPQQFELGASLLE